MAKVLEEKKTLAFDVEGYVFDDTFEVLAFLQKHPALVPVLTEAIEPLRQVFGKDTLVTLRLLDDHDTDVQLIARIRTPESVKTARGLLDQFYRDWWNANIHCASDHLIFSLEFIDG